MSHTETVRLVLDCIQKNGLLYHLLTDSTRSEIKQEGYRYAVAHSQGSSHEMAMAEIRIRALVEVQS